MLIVHVGYKGNRIVTGTMNQTRKLSKTALNHRALGLRKPSDSFVTKINEASQRRVHLHLYIRRPLNTQSALALVLKKAIEHA